MFRLYAFDFHRLLMRMALMSVGVFAWIQIFITALQSLVLQDAILLTVATYLLMQIVTVFLTPVSATSLKHGMRYSMILGTVYGVTAFVILAMMISGMFGASLIFGCILFATAFGAYRSWYWLPFTSRAGYLGLSWSKELLLCAAPLAVGYVATLHGMLPFITYGAAAMLLFSIVPLFVGNYARERFVWRYGETFSKLLALRYERISIGSMLIGIESACLFLIWPLLIFITVGMSWKITGVILSLAYCGSLFVSNFRKSHVVTPVVYAFGTAISWVVRPLFMTPISFVLVNTVSAALPMAIVSDDGMEYSHGHMMYIDEISVITEISLAIGRAVLALITLATVFVFGVSVAMYVVFVVVACVALVSFSYRLHTRDLPVV